MFKLLVVLALAVACVSAAPGAVLAAYTAPVAPAVVTAHSSQVVARNYNGLAAPLVAAPVAAPIVKAAPYVAAPVVAAAYKTAPYIAGPAPYVAAASPYIAAASPYVSPYVAAPAAYAAAPAAYAAAPAYYL